MSDNAAVNVLAGRLEQLRQEYADAKQKQEQVERQVMGKLNAIADIEAALRVLGVNPLEVGT